MQPAGSEGFFKIYGGTRTKSIFLLSPSAPQAIDAPGAVYQLSQQEILVIGISSEHRSAVNDMIRIIRNTSRTMRGMGVPSASGIFIAVFYGGSHGIRLSLTAQFSEILLFLQA